MEIERVRREIEVLHLVIPLLTEDADWIDMGWLRPSHSFEEPELQALKGGHERKGSRSIDLLDLRPPRCTAGRASGLARRRH
jgi:hypothetical protein